MGFAKSKEVETATPFPSILCGVEGNPGSTEAARQAIALAAPGATLHFLAVYTSFELGPDYSKEALQASLEEVAQLAQEAGISASTDMGSGRYAVDVLLSEGEHHDLLVLGSPAGSRAAGIVIGSTASEAAHRTERALLVTREPPNPDRSAKDILLASDGSSGSWVPARTAAGVAVALDAQLEIVHVVDGTHPERRRTLEAQVAEIHEVTGKEPALADITGHAIDGIIETAESKGSSLIVCGRRGLRGIKALGSVSERVVHRAGCSVLLIPVGEDAPDS